MSAGILLYPNPTIFLIPYASKIHILEITSGLHTTPPPPSKKRVFHYAYYLFRRFL